MERIKRDTYLHQITDLLGKGEALVLTGQRRAGKSCILEQLAAQLAENGHVIYIDMEDPANADIASFRELNDVVRGRLVENRHNYLLIDEVQEIAEFERAIRFFVKQDNIDVIVTGSNASMLSSDIASAFSGRYHHIHIGCLDYNEFLQFYKLNDSDESLSAYLRWGGFPFLHQIDLKDTRTRMDYLGSIYDTIFIKDIVYRKSIRNVSLLDNLTRFIADNSGKIFSPNSIANYLKSKQIAVSANTISEYVTALSEAYVIDRLKRYDIKGKSVFEQMEKFYFEDLGLRNYLCRDKSNLDIEKVLEGAVYLQLKRQGYEVYVGQLNGKEIDFVGRSGDELIYVQVAVTLNQPDTYEREYGNLKMIKDNHPKYVVTLDSNAALIHDSGIITLHARDFLSNTHKTT